MAATALGACSPHPVHDRVVAAARSAPSACRGPSRSSGRRRWRSGRPDARRPAVARGRGRNRCAERGGVSRPSSSAWTRTSGTPRRAASSARATRCRSLAWTPPGPDQADDVQAAVRSRARVARREQRRALEERAVGDRGVDPRQVLEDRPAGAQVQVADLGVAHLAGRQADRVLGGAQDAHAASARAGRASSASRPRRSRRRPGRGPIPNPSRTTRTSGRGPCCAAVDASGPPAGRGVTRAAAACPAVSPARATIPAISSALRDAPPTSAPSMAGSARNSPMVAVVTLPPYSTGSRPRRIRPAEVGDAARIASAIAAASAPRASGRSRSPRPARRR